MPFNPEKLKKLQARKNKGSRTGGKGSVRRKVKQVRKSAVQGDSRLKSTMARLGVRDIPQIEEVNLFKGDGSVIHFTNPTVQASIQSNTYVVSGKAENKRMEDMLPSILSQMDAGNMDQIRKMYERISSDTGDDAGIPDLVESFENAGDDDGDDDEAPPLVG